MINGIIKADGTSRLARSVADFKTRYPTYEAFAEALIAGTLPLDILFNAAGWTQIPDFLNKANLLKDSTAKLFGKDASAVPDELFAILSRAALSGNGELENVFGEKVGVRIATGSYKGTDKSGQSNPVSLTFDFAPKLVVVYGGSLSGRMGVFVYGTPTVAGATDSSALGALQVSWLANGISWYSTVEDNAANQYNDPYTYYYIAIG